MDNDRFARTIKNARLKKGYTQSQLADLLNVSNKTISKWETGRGYPDITLLAKITSVLKLDYEELLQSNEYIIQKRKKKRKDIFIISIVCFIFAITLIGMYKVQKQQDYKRNYQNIIQRLCSNYYVGNSFDFAYRKPSSLIVKKEDLLTQKKIIQLCDYLNINEFKKIKTIKTEQSFDPTFSYINHDNQDKQYGFYISNKKGKAIVVIVILNHNIIKILDDENHQVHYYQSQNINYEKLNIDHLPW